MPIDAGVRLSGKAGHYSLGLLNVQTRHVDGIAPANNFSCGPPEPGVWPPQFARRHRGGAAIDFFACRICRRPLHQQHLWHGPQPWLGPTPMCSAILRNRFTSGATNSSTLPAPQPWPTTTVTIASTPLTRKWASLQSEVGFVRRYGFRQTVLRISLYASPRRASTCGAFSTFGGIVGTRFRPPVLPAARNPLSGTIT